MATAARKMARPWRVIILLKNGDRLTYGIGGSSGYARFANWAAAAKMRHQLIGLFERKLWLAFVDDIVIRRDDPKPRKARN